jgi:hypothetical protein
VEATKNGLDWELLAAPYDASFQGDETGAWALAYTQNRPGTTSMFVRHDVNISSKFNAGDVLLFRLRMKSDERNTSWGWALDYITIQEPPLTVEVSSNFSSITLYPNPTKDKFTVDYSLRKASPVAYDVIDIYGRIIKTGDLGIRGAGMNSELFDLEDLETGTYILLLRTSEDKKSTKVIVSH